MYKNLSKKIFFSFLFLLPLIFASSDLTAAAAGTSEKCADVLALGQEALKKMFVGFCNEYGVLNKILKSLDDNFRINKPERKKLLPELVQQYISCENLAERFRSLRGTSIYEKQIDDMDMFPNMKLGSQAANDDSKAILNLFAGGHGGVYPDMRMYNLINMSLDNWPMKEKIRLILGMNYRLLSDEQRALMNQVPVAPPRSSASSCCEEDLIPVPGRPGFYMLPPRLAVVVPATNSLAACAAAQQDGPKPAPFGRND